MTEYYTYMYPQDPGLQNRVKPVSHSTGSSTWQCCIWKWITYTSVLHSTEPPSIQVLILL